MINCFAITEPRNLELLSSCLFKYPLTRLVGFYNGSSLRASDIIDLSIHIVFVDYQLQEQFRKLLVKIAPHVSVVYIAGEKEHAFQAFEDGALDYILCPFDSERLDKTINKFIRFSLLMPPAQKSFKEASDTEFFFVKPDPKGKIELLINSNDVLFVEAYQSDVVIQMADGRRFVCFHTMREMEESLSSCFMRVHKSFIINYKKMSAFDGSNIIIETNQQFRIPLGGVYKKSFLDRRNTMVIRKPTKGMEDNILRRALTYLLMFFLLDVNVVDTCLCFG